MLASSACGYYSRLDYYVSVRLHGAISAFLLNVLSLFEYHPKCSDFLIDSGKEALCRLIEGGGNLRDVMVGSFEGRAAREQTDSRFADAAVLNFSRAPWAAKFS